MKKYELSHELFNGQVGTLSRRAVINEMLDNRTVFETPIERVFKTARKYLFIAGIIALLILSLLALQRWLMWDTIEKSTISAIYHGTSKEVEANKAKAFQKLEIAGASGEGRRITK
jgi:hypothetical protein